MSRAAPATLFVISHGAVGIEAMAAPCWRSHEGALGFGVFETAPLVFRGRLIVKEITQVVVRS